MKERISLQIIFYNLSENALELRVWSLPRFNHWLHATLQQVPVAAMASAAAAAVAHTSEQQAVRDDRDSHISISPEPIPPQLGGFWVFSRHYLARRH